MDKLDVEKVDLDKFWDMMCHPSFVRTGLHYGIFKGRYVSTCLAPEEIEGFIEGKINTTICSLMPSALWKRLLDMIKKMRINSAT